MDIYQELDETTLAQVHLINDELTSLKIRIRKLVEGIDELHEEIRGLRSELNTRN